MFLWLYSDNQFFPTLRYQNDPTCCVVVSSGVEMVSNGWYVVIFSEGLEGESEWG